MSKFDNAKVGDRVWYIIKGWGEVEHVIKNIGIRVRFKVSETVEVSEVFTFDGKRYELNDKYPMLFWNEVKLPTDEEDKKPFNLVEYLRENLEPKEFENGKLNYYLNFIEIYDNCWKFEMSRNTDMISVCFKEGKRDVEIDLIRKKVTPQQLKEAYRELGWL